MVVLNDSIYFNLKSLKTNLINEINNSIMLNFNILYHDNEDLKKIFKNVNKHIKDKINNLFLDNYFIYLNMDENKCTHIYKKGKKKNYVCNKTIKTNLNGQKKDYLCCTHSKKHIPKPKKNKGKFLIKEEKLNIIHKQNFNGKVRKIRNKKKKNIYIGNCGFLDLSNILKKCLIN